MYQKALSIYRPGAIVSLLHPESARPFPPSQQGMVGSSSRPVAFICSNFVCSAPASTVTELEESLKSLSRKAGVEQ